MTTTHQALPNDVLDLPKLKKFFVNHLNRVYCAKAHLQERLPEIQADAHFTDLVNAITETLIDVEKQLARMQLIFEVLGIQPGFENCQGLVGLIEEATNTIHKESDPYLSDLSILFYLQNIESIEVASFKMLSVAAPYLESQDIDQWLRECLDEATDDLDLLQAITAYYLNK